MTNVTAERQEKSAVETVSVWIDGQAYDVPKTMPHPVSGEQVGTTMIQACHMHGIDVPYYCYHPKLPVAGNCRMCLVEFGTPALGPDRQPLYNEDGSPQIRKSPRPVIACATPISPGMAIYTQTPEAKQMRESVLEFLLINHPLDCPICDQAGECKLQEYAVDYGKADSRFVEQKVHKPKQVDLGPRIMLDDERCILCSRCIRFTRDIAGDDALGFADRGSYSILTNYPGKPFDNNYTLNTADICPVGALTSKDFRFQMRVWFLKETKSVCTSCGTGCNIMIGSRNDRIYRYTPRENDAVNSCWMCDYGRLNYKWINREDRLREVQQRRDGAPAKTNWSMALKEVAERIESSPSGSIGVVASARLTNEELYLVRRLVQDKDAITDSVPRMGEADHLLVDADKNPNTNGAHATGIAAKKVGADIATIADRIRQGKIKTLLVFGEDVTKHGIEADLLKELDTLVVSDILPNATTERADYLLPGCAHAEKRGTFTNAKGRVQKFMKAIEGPGDARPEWEFLHELVQRKTHDGGSANLPALFNEMAEQVPAFHGLSWGELKDTGAQASL